MYGLIAILLSLAGTALLFVSSITLARRVPSRATLVASIGFLCVVIGLVLMNIAPMSVKHIHGGDIVTFTRLFAIGQVIGAVGYLVAGIASCVFAFGLRGENPPK